MQTGLLDINDYISITGLDLGSEIQIAMFNRANARATRKLIQILGWDPTYRTAYEEAAISKIKGACPTEEQLELWRANPVQYPYFAQPDFEVGMTKLFPYYPEDANYFIDPCTAVHSVKVVKVLSSDVKQFITVWKFAPDAWDQKTNVGFLVNHQPIIRWIEICDAPDTLGCECEDGKSCYMLAIDADWLQELPDDLAYVLADLTLFQMQHQPSLAADTTYAVKSESVDGHSVTYDTTTTNESAWNTEDDVLKPYLDMLKMYAGPYSILYINKTRVV